MPDLKATSWVDECASNSAPVRLFCFPSAGGNPQTFRGWQHILGSVAEIYPVVLPGRGRRLAEQPFTRIDSLVRALAAGLLPWLNTPFAFFGHSMGALVAYELAKELRDACRLEPVHLFIAARRAPHIKETSPVSFNLPHSEFLAALRALTGTPEELLSNSEAMDLITPILRADFEAVETYKYKASRPLSCPITAIGGLEDTTTDVNKLKAWREHTTGKFSCHLLPGESFLRSWGKRIADRCPRSESSPFADSELAVQPTNPLDSSGAPRANRGNMDFGIMFFSSVDQVSAADKYRLVLDASRFADENGFRAIWTPERHFDAFGGLFPNPSVLSSALAVLTKHIEIRAGSLISPLHNSIRIAEEWSVVDNLSGGRAAVSFGSGWNVDDFIFFPDRYANRQSIMFDQIDEVTRLWRGETLTVQNSAGKETRVTLFPRPVQPTLPIWITSSGNPNTFVAAGERGFNVLTHLLGQDTAALAEKISLYRQARREKGFDPLDGKVTLMLHTFLGSDIETVRAKVKGPFQAYLAAALKLEVKAASAGGTISGGHKFVPDGSLTTLSDDLLDITFDRYFKRGALMGTPNSCQEFVWQLQEIGVTEIACLLDFGLDPASVLEGLRPLSELTASLSPDVMNNSETREMYEFMEPLPD